MKLLALFLVAIVGSFPFALAQSPSALRFQLDRLIIPTLNLQDASFDSAVDFIGQKTRDLSGGKVALNVVKAYPKPVGDRTISLSLSGVPVSTALDYVAQLGGVTVDYEARAVVLRAPAAVPPPPPSAP